MRPPAAEENSLGLVAGDAAGYPNGRRIGDDVDDLVQVPRIAVAVGGEVQRLRRPGEGLRRLDQDETVDMRIQQRQPGLQQPVLVVEAEAVDETRCGKRLAVPDWALPPDNATDQLGDHVDGDEDEGDKQPATNGRVRPEPVTV